jgi:branched-chain amino acid transport system substrate-binding protein
MFHGRMRRGRKWAVAATSLLLVTAACTGDDDTSTTTTTAAPATSAAPGTSAEPTTSPAAPGFIIGYLRPPAGVLAQLTAGQELALRLAVDDINAAGGIRGTMVGSVAVSEPLDGNLQTAVDQLVDAGANVILGPAGSTSALALIPLLEPDKQVACSASATSPLLTETDTDGWFFRTALSDSFTVGLAADRVAAARDAAGGDEDFRVGILARSDDYGIGVGNGLGNALIARGIEVDIINYDPHRVIFTSEAQQLAEADDDLIVVVSYGESPRQIDALVTAGVPADRIAGLDSFLEPRLGQQSFPDNPAMIDGVRVFAATGDRAFIQRMVAADSTVSPLFGAQAYDCAITVALAATAAGTTTADGYRAQLPEVTNGDRVCSTYADCVAKVTAGEDIAYSGATGEIRFDENGDPSHARYTTLQFQDGGQLNVIDTQDLSITELRQQEALAAALFTTRLQQALKALGFYDGPIDGIPSDELTAAIADLQSSLGLPVTGVYDAETDAALRERLGTASLALSQSTATLQAMLAQYGFYDGPIDGVYGPETIAAVRAFQAALGVPQTGIIDVATLTAAFNRGITIGTPPTPPDTTAPQTTPAPATSPPAAQTTTTVAPTAPPTAAPTQPPTAAPTPAPTTASPATEPPTTEASTTTTSVPQCPTTPPAGSLLEVLVNDGRFGKFLQLLCLGGFNTGDFSNPPYTVFAPIDDALPQQAFDALKNDPQLATKLASHILEGSYSTSQLVPADYFPLSGAKLTVTAGPPLSIGPAVGGTAEILEPELPAGTNGVVHPISAVLNPPLP